MVVVVVEGAEAGAARPPVGTPIRVQLRDTTYADAPARVVAEADARVEEGGAGRLASVQLDVPAGAGGELTAWAHVAVDEDLGSVTTGDLVTTASYPVTDSDAGVPVRVRVNPV